MNHVISYDSCGVDDDLCIDPVAHSMQPTSPNRQVIFVHHTTTQARKIPLYTDPQTT